jgi:hypothetical protein
MGKGGRITYGDGSQSKVIGKGIIDIPGLETSQEALYVEGLKANLLSISQFWDNDLVVQFSKKECNKFDSSGKWLMGGKRNADNCYGLPSLTTDPQIFCNKVTIDDSELWHRRLGHLNFSDMLKIASKEIVKDLPKMEKTGKGICDTLCTHLLFILEVNFNFHYSFRYGVNLHVLLMFFKLLNNSTK